jgi:myo-inositol-1(or 4)-monophosphatase
MTSLFSPELLGQTLAAVREAGTIISNHWDLPRRIQKKGRIDLVTETDVAVEKALTGMLRDILPDAGFLAEESSSDAPLGSLTWVIDPLDGTTNFAHHLPFVAVSVGLWHEDGVRLGVVHNPILGETFHAASGEGAFLNGEPIRVSKVETLDAAVVATGFPYAIEEHVGPILGWLEQALVHCQGVRRYGAAALDMAYLACGRLDAFYETQLRPWDTAAGWVLVEEAGGKVSRYASDEPYSLGAPTMLASNGRLHQAMRNILSGR